MNGPEEELRRIEWRARQEQAELESDSVQLHRASRTLARYGWELMQAGMMVRVVWPGGDTEGAPLWVERDLLVLESPTLRMGVNLVAVSSLAAAGRMNEPPPALEGLGSFVAWCRMLEGFHVHVALRGSSQVSGRLLAVAQDHLVVAGDVEAAVAISDVAMVGVWPELLGV